MAVMSLHIFFFHGAGAAGALSGPAGPPPHASKIRRRSSSPPSELLLLGGNPDSQQQQQSLANTLLYCREELPPLQYCRCLLLRLMTTSKNTSTFTTINAEKPARDQVLLPRPQPLRGSGPVPDAPAQGIHTKQTTGLNNGLINGYVTQALDSSSPLIVPLIGYQLPSRDDQKQDEIFIPHNNVSDAVTTV